MTQRIAVGLTVANAVILVVLLAQMRPLTAQGTPGTSGFPDTAVLRLMDPVTGRPSVKLSTSEKGSGLMLLGDAKTRGTWVILESEGQTNKLRVKTENEPEQLLKP